MLLMRYDYEQEKTNTGYFPSQGERLEGFTERVRVILGEEWEYLQSHTKWYVHRGTGPCPICNIYNCSVYITNIMIDINSELKRKKLKLVCERGEDTNDPLMYRFKLTSR